MGITHTYEYDSLGNITSIYDSSKTTTYKYDALNQLVRADNPYENKTHIYTYENGNITEDKVYEYTTGNLPEYPESKTQYLYENATWSDILTGVKKSHFDNGVEIIDDRYSISSDTIGNITNLNGSEYSWLGRQLQSVSNSDNSNTTYSYNADGQRIAKVVNSANGDEYNYGYYYNGDILAGYKLVITKSDGSSTTHNVAFMYDENGEAFGFNYNGNDYYYVRNAQNDVVRIVDSANETVVSYQYDSWGKLLSCEDTSENDIVSFINPYTYRGYYYDSDTEMYFLKSRYYNPELCRFISADDSDILFCTPDDITDKNLFSYCDNNPICRVDTDGEFWGIVVTMAVGGITESVISIINQKNENGFVNIKCVAVNFMSGAIAGAFSMSGAGIIASIAFNAILSGVTCAAEQVVAGKKVNAKNVAKNVAVGAISGALGGKCTNGKQLNNTWKTAKKTIMRETRRANVKYATKQTAVATAEKVAVKHSVFSTTINNVLNSISIAFSKWKLRW